MILSPLIKFKRFYTFLFIGFAISIGFLFLRDIEIKEENKISKTEIISENYNSFLENHPFRKSMKLSKEERLDKGLPPNKFYEQEWLYTSDPVLLRPAPEKVHLLQKELANNSQMKSAPGDPSNNWVERGPNNVGGRTHTLMFAPGSAIKVFAGGVSGGLWVNEDITSNATEWEQVSGVSGNLAVMCITVDPNDTNIMYIGTGEVYTWGAVNGNGVYKSVDGGENWVNIYSGGTTVEDKITYVQDIIAWNNPQTNQTEVFFGADAMAYTEEVTSGSGGAGWSYLGANTIGLYRSTDGTNFNRLTGSLYEYSSGNYYAPNSFDIGTDGKLWMGTKYSYAYGGGGGVVFSNDGIGAGNNGWAVVRNLGDNGRVELACSKQDADKIYALCEDRTDGANPVKIYRTTNGFSSAPTSLSQPNDDDTGIASTDFTRGQSFYDLMIGVDPTDDTTLYVGGIDLFKSTNSGNSWSQFTHWYGGFGHQEVHADQHGIAFAGSNRILFGNDGGVFYTNDGGTTTNSRNNGYNVTQFYKAAINQPIGTDILLAGAQDNGSQLIINAPAGIGSSTEVTGGDGCWAFIDQDDEYMISSYVYNNYRYITYAGTYLGNFPDATNDGDFVNQCGLDSATNNLYSNGTSGSTYRIYRWNITPSVPSVGKTTLSNAMLNTVPTYFAASPYTSDRILVGTALGKIIRLNNASGTPTWTDISIPGQVGAVSDIRYGDSENDIMVTFHNYGVTSIWYSSNGNSGSPTWVSKEGNLPDMPVKSILQNPLSPEEVIIGTELGVWKTSDWSNASPTWVQSQNGMSDVKVLSFDFRSADNTILVATFGRGMFTGKFEVEDCAATTTYNSGWNSGIPTSSRSAIIYSDYDTAIGGAIDACTLRVTEGITITVRAGDYIKIEGDITIDNNATLIIEHEGSLVQVDDTALVTNNGSISVEKITTSLEPLDFTILGSPMTGATREVELVVSTLVKYHDTSLFNPNTDVTAYDSGAENFADDNGDNWITHTGLLVPGEGYLVRPASGGGTLTTTYNTGTLNNGIITYTAIFGDDQNDSPNILSNPYASAIRIDDFLTANSFAGGTLYFWEHITPQGTDPNYPGYQVANYDMGDISYCNGTGGLAAANGGSIPTNFLPSGQGFGIKASGAGVITFNNALRSTSPNTGYRKNETAIDRLYLGVSNNTYGLRGQTLIGFTELATDGFDQNYDSKRLATPISLYSLLDERELGIQGRSVFHEDHIIPLGFTTHVAEDQEYKISIGAIEGILLEQATVYLKDKLLNTLTNLSETDYSFTSNEGHQIDRFELLFETEPILSIDDLERSIAIYPNPTNTVVNINSVVSPIKSVIVYDLQGREVKQWKGDAIPTIQLDLSGLKTSVYLIKITTTQGSITQRLLKW